MSHLDATDCKLNQINKQMSYILLYRGLLCLFFDSLLLLIGYVIHHGTEERGQYHTEYIPYFMYK